jgi:hypothetical protein
VAALTSDLSERGDTGLTLKPAQFVILTAFSTCVWFLAAMFIRFVGPMGVFHGYRALALYALTIPATLPLNARSRKLVRAPRSQMDTVIAVTSAVATMLDGVAMSQFPALYGCDPAITGAGAAWLLWAIGVAGALSLITASAAVELDPPGRAPLQP